MGFISRLLRRPERLSGGPTAIHWGAGGPPAEHRVAVTVASACVQLLRSSFRAAAVTTAHPDALHAEWLAGVVHAIATRGEALFLPDASGGRVRLLPARVPAQIEGESPDEEEWRFRLSLHTPSGGVVERWTRRPELLRFQWAADPSAAWRSASPLAASGSRLLIEVETMLLVAARSPHLTYLSVPFEGEDEFIRTRRAEANDPGNRGAVLVVDEGETIQPTQIRPALDPAAAELHRDLVRQVAGLYGVPVQLILPASADGTSQREALRRLYTTNLQGLARSIESEVRRLDPSFAVDLRALRAADAQGAARAARSLADAGVPIDKALSLTGFDA